MPRRHRRPQRPDGPLPPGGPERVEEHAGGDWVVRQVSGAAAAKSYRCPGCEHEIRPGTPHIVAWPAEGPSVADRRHWHGPCWAARDRRGPRPQRGPRAY